MTKAALSKVFHEICCEIQEAPTDPWQQKDERSELKEKIVHLIEKKVFCLKSRKRLREEFFQSGPLTSLLDKEEVNEIIVNQYDKIWIEKQTSLTLLEDSFLSEISYLNFLKRICEDIKTDFNIEKPFAEGRWKNFRTHIISSPLSSKCPLLTLRRTSLNRWSLDDLIKQGWSHNPATLSLLNNIIEQRKNILVVGPTGSGKTTLINALLQLTPSSERSLIIEEVDEIKTPNEVSCKLLTHESLDKNFITYSQQDLIKHSLRMRPDRLILGEIRANEAKDFLQALATGHSGSLASIHASHPQQAILRLETLIQQATNWSAQSIKKLIHLSLDYLILVEKKGEERKLKGVYQIAGLEDRIGLLIETVLEEKDLVQQI